MADRHDMELMAHLTRRAGFGATHEELEACVAQGYERTVELLLEPLVGPDIDEAIFFRYHPMAEVLHETRHAQMNWLFRMVNSQRPLREKMALFWHNVFATGYEKVTAPHAMHTQIGMFREHGMGNYRDLMVRLAQDPAMIYWLDNEANHKRNPNENWGRELLELFSLGVGYYTEKDVYDCARAFTGWTFDGKSRGIQLGPLPWTFRYRPEDHDEGQKTFLGHTGNFNGEDIIDILVRQPACARFITRHLYSAFVADEPEVPKWPSVPPQDPQAITLLSETFMDSGLEIKPVLRVLFNSDFFKNAAHRKVKSPLEIVVGTLKLAGAPAGPDPSWPELARAPALMGQDIMNPPTVEGWHTGREWINSGALINRVNFVADRLKDTTLPGVASIVGRVSNGGSPVTAETLVTRCLQEMGVGAVEPETFQELVSYVRASGPVDPGANGKFLTTVGNLLALIAGAKEYQFG